MCVNVGSAFPRPRAWAACCLRLLLAIALGGFKSTPGLLSSGGQPPTDEHTTEDDGLSSATVTEVAADLMEADQTKSSLLESLVEAKSQIRIQGSC